MPAHLRTQLRLAAVSALGALATSSSRVYAGRTRPMLDADLPGLRISSGDQDINQIGVNPNPTEQSTLELVIECCAKAAANIEDVLDQMAKEVQITMSANQTLAGAKRAFIKSIEPDLDGEGEKEYGVLRLTYHVLFNSAQNAPDVAT